MTWVKILSIVVVLLLIWMLYRQYKANPQMFSKENFSKSFFSMGILALLLIGFITIVVMLLR